MVPSRTKKTSHHLNFDSSLPSCSFYVDHEARVLHPLNPKMALEENIKQASESIKNADAILITAGAGIGVDSGLPDFRGNQGFWKAYPPIARLGISFTEMANPEWFHRNPKLAWAFYGHRLNLYRNTIPHQGFGQILDVARDKPGGYFVFTSNVDGQFQKAGYDEDSIEECHGSIHHFQCSEPCSDDIWEAENTAVEVDELVFEALDPLPKCIRCNAVARPNILMFGDGSWIGHRSNSQNERLSMWLDKLAAKSMELAILEIGAGTSVPTVRYKSEQIAASLNETLIRINPREYHVPTGQISVPLGGGEGIHRIVELVEKGKDLIPRH